MTKRAYVKPAMRVYKLREHPQLLDGSKIGNPKYNPFNDEKDW